MAQIIKYSLGGSTKKQNTFTIDGNSYEVNNDLLNQLTEYSKTLDEDTSYQFGKIIDALKSGENLSYNSSANKLTGNVNFEVTDDQNNRLSRRRSRLGRAFGNLWNGKENNSRKAINSLKDFTYNPTINKSIYDWSKKINVEYKRDKDNRFELVDGKRVFIPGANSLQALRRLDELKNIANYNDNDTFIGYNGLQKQAYIDLYNRLGPEGIEALQNRIRTGTWTEEDKLALDDIGTFLGDEPTLEEVAQRKAEEIDPTIQAEEKEKERYRKAGWDYNLKNIFGIDDNGNVTIIDPKLRSYIGDGDVWLNDEFREVHSNYADYIPEKTGLFVINGRVYKGDDQNSLSKIQKYIDFVNENKRTAGNASNIKQYWDPNRSVSPWNSTSIDSEGNPMWSPYFAPNKFAADRSGEYVRQPGDPLVYDYLPNYNSEDASQFDVYGHPLKSLAERIYIDPITKQRIDFKGNLQRQLNTKAIESYYNDNHNTAFNPYYTIGDKGGYKQIANVGSASNPNSMAALYYNPELNRYYYYDENPGNNNLTLNSKLSGGSDKMRDYYWNIDPRLGLYIKEHPEILANENVKKLIGETIQNPYLAYITTRRQTDFSPLMSSYPELYKLLQDLYKTQTLQYGNTQQEFNGSGGNQNLRNITTPEELERLGLAYRIPKNKKGGVLKYQIGGVSANRSNSFKASKESIKQSNSKLRSAGEDKVIGDGTALSTSDKAEIAALITDAASLGATFVPIYGNAASAGIGAIGSFTGFGADIARDGLDWGDIGNLALNLGLDAATLIPGAGTGAKATKLAKALKNSKAVAKAIKYASLSVSAGSALNGLNTAWNNIQDGSWTIKDIRTVLNGIRGIANVRRTTGKAKTKEVTGDTVTLKPQEKGLPTIKLNRLEIESIQNAPKNTRADKLEEIIINHLPKDTKTDHIQDILNSYGIKRSESINWNWKKPFSLNRDNTINSNQFKYDMIPGTYRNPNELGWWNWNRRAAVRDAKVNPENPYFRPLHWKTGNVSDLNLANPITMPIYSNLAFDYGIFSNTPEKRYYYDMSDKPTFYKTGGKIIKANKGLSTNKINYDFTDQFNKDFGNNLGKETYVGTLNGPRINKQLPIIDNVTDITNNLNTNNIDQLSKSELFDSKSQYGHGSTNWNLFKNINPDMLLGVTDFLTKNTAQNKLKKAGYRAAEAMGKSKYKSYVHRQNVPYFQGDLERARNINRENILNGKFVHSDPRLMMTYKLGQSSALNEADSHYLNAISNRFSEHQKASNEINFDNKVRAAQVGDIRRSADYLTDAAKAQVDQSYIAQKAQSLGNLIYQGRQNLARDIEEKKNAALLGLQLKAESALDKDLESKFMSEYKNDPNFAQYGNIRAWAAANKPSEFSKLQSTYFANFPRELYNTAEYRHSWYPFMAGKLDYIKTPYSATPQVITKTNILKKGGTIKRYRDVDEQRYLDQQKAIDKAVNDLNNNIVRLFLKMMS